MVQHLWASTLMPGVPGGEIKGHSWNPGKDVASGKGCSPEPGLQYRMRCCQLVARVVVGVGVVRTAVPRLTFGTRTRKPGLREPGGVVCRSNVRRILGPEFEGGEAGGQTETIG